MTSSPILATLKLQDGKVKVSVKNRLMSKISSYVTWQYLHSHFLLSGIHCNVACATQRWGSPIAGMGGAGAGDVVSQSSGNASNSACECRLCLFHWFCWWQKPLLGACHTLRTNILCTSIASCGKITWPCPPRAILTNQHRITLSTVLLLLYVFLIVIG